MRKSNKNLILRSVNQKQKRNALYEFGDLLKSETKERDWQNFFDNNPFVLTESLSLKLDGLYRQVPLISGTPDYVFCRNTGNTLTGDYGVIELKRPDHSIIGAYSSKIIAPSSKLSIATQEVTQHLNAIHKGGFVKINDFFLAGNRQYAFIIIGLTSEILNKCKNEILELQFQKFLPCGFHLYTYDELFRLFSSNVQPIIQVLYANSQNRTLAVDDKEEFRQYLMNVDWEKMTLYLRLYAKSKIDKIYWKDGVLPKGIEVDDLVMDSIASIFDGSRKWDINKKPNLQNHLKTIINSKISNLYSSLEYKTTNRQKASEEEI